MAGALVVLGATFLVPAPASAADTTRPSVSITAPTSGSTASGTMTLTANASDNVGVVGVRFKLDGVNLGPEDMSLPYSAVWNTTTASNGAHTLTAVARDAAGNTRTSAAVTVTVSNPIIPTWRTTMWRPGLMSVGGIPHRTTVCATVRASTYGNGTVDATAGIQAAIDACPVGQVVRLSAGNFLVNGEYPITIDKGIVLRGAGPSATKLRRTSTAFDSPLIVVGQRWLTEAGSVNLTANAPKGATSIRVTSTAGFSVGQLVLVDERTDDAYVYWGTDPAAAPGGEARGWFTRFDRPVGQMLEIASISGTTVTFTTPLHIAFDTAHAAQLTRWDIPYGARYAGVEDLYVRGGRDDNITMRLAMYSWVKHVESDFSLGDSVALDACFRCVIRDSYFHDTPEPNPGGGGYLLSIAYYTADSLVENNIFINGNKVMVMRASGGGNVIGYNYFDNGYIGYSPGWVETGLNASHMAEPHFELFEGNQAFNIDGDDTWGGAVYNTFFRNHATGKRRSFDDLQNRRAIGLMYGHYYYNFVGNVLGYAGMSPAPYSGFAYEDFHPWQDDPLPMWRLGYAPGDWEAPADPRVAGTVHRHGNFDYATNVVRWKPGYARMLPRSLYLTGKPAFFGANPWPWVEPARATKLQTLPARQRYDAGTPNIVP
jgi:Big-like domain-containing protein